MSKPSISQKESAWHPPRLKSGLRVRTNLQAGNWKCSDCSGQQTSSGLYQAKCDYCIHQ